MEFNYRKLKKNDEIYTNLKNNLDAISTIDSDCLDWSDIGNEIGRELGKFSKKDIELFLDGIIHGISEDCGNNHDDIFCFNIIKYKEKFSTKVINFIKEIFKK